MEQPPRKRARVVPKPVFGGSHRGFLRAVGPPGRVAAAADRLRRDELERMREQRPPHGPLLQEVRVPAKGGLGEIVVAFVHPIVLLIMLAERSEGFRRMLLERCHAGYGDFVVCCDEAKPGNQLRPEVGRTFWGAYWTLTQFEDFWRAGTQGFQTLLVMSVKTCRRVEGGFSKVMQAVLAALFGGDKGMDTTGFLLPAMVPSMPQVCIKLRFATLLADELALRTMLGAKGASGNKPCVRCKNIVARNAATRAEHSQYLQTVDSAEFDRFDQYNAQSLALALSRLKETYEGSTRREHETAEKMYGYNYFPMGNVLSPGSVVLRDFPHSAHYDAMHSLLASGGVCSYEINNFLLKAREFISLQNTQSLSERLRLPCNRRLSFALSERLTHHESGHHLKGFAMDCLDLLPFVEALIHMVLAPQQIMQLHCRCFRLMREVVDVLTGQKAMEPQQLREVNRQHRLLYDRLYEDCVKPKLHFVWHCIDSLERWGQALTTFAPERRHRLGKQVAAHSYKESHDTILRRTTLHMLDSIKDERFARISLLGTVQHAEPPPVAGQRSGPWFRSATMRGARGRIAVGDVARCQSPGGLVYGVVLHILQQLDAFYLLVVRLEAIAATRFRRGEHRLLLLVNEETQSVPFLENPRELRIFQ
jgi:hypothetical protein